MCVMPMRPLRPPSPRVDVSEGRANDGGAQAAEAMFRQVWNEPRFQRALAESYLRGSEVEPQLTQREAQFRTEVLDLISKQKLEDATSRLQSLQGKNAVFDFMLGNIYFGQNKFPEAALEYSKAVAQMSTVFGPVPIVYGAPIVRSFLRRGSRKSFHFRGARTLP